MASSNSRSFKYTDRSHILQEQPCIHVKTVELSKSQWLRLWTIWNVSLQMTTIFFLITRPFRIIFVFQVNDDTEMLLNIVYFGESVYLGTSNQ